MLKLLFSRKPEFALVPMQATDCAEVSALHASRFAQGWNDGEFHSLLTQQTVFGLVARRTNGWFAKRLSGFVLARAVAGEAEILTIAVDPALAREGLGWRLMQAALSEARRRGAEEIFLEVDDGNQPALGLYRKLGFEKSGERAAYYADKDGRRSSALVMRRVLR